MPYLFLRGGGLRMSATNALFCLSIAMVNSPALADELETAESTVQLNSRVPAREADVEDRAQYPGLTIVKPGISTSATRKQAVTELPLDRLSSDAHHKSQSVLKNIGMFRKLPTISFECDSEVYEYFLRNPDVAVSTWRAMGISQFQLQESGPNSYRADAGDGSVGEVEIFLQTPNEVLIHCDGAFKSPLLPKPIVARSLMRLQTSFVKEPDGRVIGTHSGDVFVEFPSLAVEAIAKAISPVSHSIADRNFKQMTLFVHLMSQAMARHPEWVELTGNKLDGISKQKKYEFLDVAAKCSSESRKRIAIANGVVPFSPEDVLTPFRQWNAQGTGMGTNQPPTKVNGNRPLQTANQPGTATLRN